MAETNKLTGLAYLKAYPYQSIGNALSQAAMAYGQGITKQPFYTDYMNNKAAMELEKWKIQQQQSPQYAASSILSSPLIGMLPEDQRKNMLDWAKSLLQSNNISWDDFLNNYSSNNPTNNNYQSPYADSSLFQKKGTISHDELLKSWENRR